MPSLNFKPWDLGRLVHLRPARPSQFFDVLTDLVGPLYARTALLLDQVRVKGAAHLIGEYQSARQGQSRFLVAFRHPGDYDAQMLFWVFNKLLKKEFRAAGLPARGGQHFIASAEIPLWASALVRYAMQAAGVIPLSHGAASRDSMDLILKTIVESTNPILIAPEGQVSYVSRSEPDLDLGAGQLALWARQRLAAQGSGVTDVRLLPVGIVYSFPRETPARVHRFLDRLEKLMGQPGTSGAADSTPLAQRLGQIWDAILDRGEAYYRATYQYQPSTYPTRRDRCLALGDFALSLAETYFGRSGQGNLRERVMSLRSHTMDLSFVEDPRPQARDALGQALAERGAAEAYWLHRHQEFADLSWYLRDEDLEDAAGFDSQVESAQNLFDLAQRLVGGSFGTRPAYFRRAVEVRFGPAVGTADCEALGRKAALTAIQTRLTEAYQNLIAATQAEN